MKTAEIKNNIFWVGAVDWNLRDFHGYSTEKGSSYNAYLIKDKKNVLIDTVKVDLIDRLLENIRNVLDPTQIDYIVINHAEMDHSGALPKMIEIVKPDKIFCSAKCKETLQQHFHREDWPLVVVADGEEIEIGARTLKFYDSKMLHWPESMTTYVASDGLLFSNDIFGAHWAASERFDDQVDQGELHWQSAKYYANIFYPFAKPAQKYLSKLKDENINLNMIAPDHGLIWRKDIAWIMDAYQRWSMGAAIPKAVVAYASMWGSTRKMAEMVGKGISQEDVSVRVMDLNLNHRSDIVTELLEAKALVLGSSVMNNQILPIMGDLLTYLKGLRPHNKIGAAFGSYGWANKGVKMLNEALEELKIEVVESGVSTQYVPTEDALKQCLDMGIAIGKAIKANLSA